jgi:hypothetical protein
VAISSQEQAQRQGNTANEAYRLDRELDSIRVLYEAMLTRYNGPLKLKDWALAISPEADRQGPRSDWSLSKDDLLEDLLDAGLVRRVGDLQLRVEEL